MARRAKVEPGSGNLFADLGLPDAKAHRLEAQIVSTFPPSPREAGRPTAKSGRRVGVARMGISQPEVSRLFNGHFREYSVDRLMGFLTAFGRDVEIVVRPRAKAHKGGRIIFKPVA